MSDAALPRPRHSGLRGFLFTHRAVFGTLAVLVLMMLVFFAANATVFLRWQIYSSVLVTLPVAIFLVVPLVFIVTVGEIDLSFPATFGVAAWVFALVAQAGLPTIVAVLAAIVAGGLIGAFVGGLVLYGNLSSLVATLGMNFMLRGFILIVTQAKSIALVDMMDDPLAKVLSGDVFGVPAQMFWAIGFVVIASQLYDRHRFGARLHCAGDNPDSAAQMGIDVKRVKLMAFAFMGVGAGLAGVFSTLINFTWWPTAGDGYLLTAIASVFVGGTPTWGGIGTVVGGALGATIVSFIQTGVVAAGLSGFYTQFFNGLIIILALLGHRFNQSRYR
jgi:ribose/xylose/arabinose/galactoside ABC-type transport system permease subunit